MIAEFVRFLATAPVSASEPSFSSLVVQPVDASQPPLAEWDLRGRRYGAPEVAALAAQHLNTDTAFFVGAKWDLWTFDADKVTWQQQPQPLLLICHGPAYDEGTAEYSGHFVADLGFEHLFTGHGGLLAPALTSNPFASSDHPLEHTFRRWMSEAGNLKEYHAKTRENIQLLFNWVEAIERALPVERSELSSEGEENFEARLDAIAAQR